ncbi:MAG: MerR family transcriptional regulator [Firmicutes bacterium]|nr:MerR family transcriptional regulator [Bacillota bacterium]
MFTIGRFSRMCRLKPSTLRVYEKLGIIAPARVDEANSYRYYSQEQLELIESVLFMKDLGLPLNKIKEIVNKNPDGEQMILMLEEYKELLIEQIKVYKARLAKVAAWQKTILEHEIEAFLEELDQQIKENVTAGPKVLFTNESPPTLNIWMGSE